MSDADAIDQLAATLDALDNHLRTSDATVRRSERNRLNMLHVHAGAAMLIAPAFMLLGRGGMQGPNWVAVRAIPGSPYSLGALLLAGGAVLGAGTAYRALRWEMLGLWILLSWYATICLSFTIAVAAWIQAGHPDGSAKPSPYAPILYLHFVAIMSVHLRTLYRIRRYRRRGH